MVNLIKCEMIKLRKSLTLKVLFVLMLALSAITSLSSLSYVGSPMAQTMEIALSGFDAFFSSLRDMPTIAIIGVLVVGFCVCNDFENRTIQSEIAAGHSRTSVLFSKIVAVFVAYAVVLLPYPLGRAILQGMLIQFGVPISLANIVQMLASFFTILLLGIALNGITLLLAIVIRKPIIVMGTSFVLIVLGGNALLSFGVSNNSIGELLAGTPLGLFRELAIREYAFEYLALASAVSIVCILIVVIITGALFRKAELK